MLAFQSCIILISFLFYQESKGSDEFLSFSEPSERSSEICCNDDTLISCTKVILDPAHLSKKKIILKGIKLTFSNSVEPNGYDYKNHQGDEALISYNKDTGNMFGTFTTHDGRSFAIEKCHDGHVWKEFNVSKFGEDATIDPGVNVTFSIEKEENRQSIATYSVMFYYTPQFKAVTADVDGFIDQIIDATNEGYINSKMTIRVRKFCSELATLNDNDVQEANLGPLVQMKGSISALTQTADAATLLVYQNSRYCGYANFFNRRYALSVNQKNCALGGYTFGHELGHNLGADHDPRVVQRPLYADGQGHLILPSGSGYRTIMAYSFTGHTRRVNYYSNPSVTFPATGTPTGITGVSNNARVITLNRNVVAAYGDESGSCSGMLRPGAKSNQNVFPL